ncbi:hypothetical protein DE146DRAFT_194714 [Phaeosphaeria sp. MPI-PUGE-AT-0046c]|nr:hypothetical protein DE146DRAFT_194714 [Phaeosphaeria sp. MPI-PUGE-AT-0046c]
MSDDDDLDDGHSPRKRRRLGSASHTRRHARGHRQGDNYRDEYRVLFNDHVTQTVSRAPSGGRGSETMGHFSGQLGVSQWSATEKAAFFAALDRVGRHDLAGIAAAVATKTQPEVAAFLALLHDAAARRGPAKLTLCHIPAAVDVGGTCAEQLDDAADALAWYQECLEAAQEQQRHGDYWLITPNIAAEIEGAVRQQDDGAAGHHGTNSRGRQTPSSDLPLDKRGRGIAGACVLCKERKKKCDRKSPCAYCIKSGVQCSYSQQAPAATRHDDADHHTASLAIPEAALLRPDMMLKLSRDIFMNRSTDFPSPWLHWSQYTSELATEPSIYRTAFNDFHTLVASVTRRLVQTAIAQATSRLRAQRHRNTKSVTPFIKLRDAYSAIHVLGLARNGHERWRRVPRRCGLKVFTHKYVPKRGREKRELSWSEVEQALSFDMMSDGARASQSDASIEPDDYKSRMARSGTPLPMHNLTLSDPESGLEHTDPSEDDDSVFSEQSVDDDPQVSARSPPLSGELVSTSPSIPSDSATHEGSSNLQTAQDFDHAASKEEEDALCRLLGFQAPAKSAPPSDSDQEDLHMNLDEKITTAPKDWEQYCVYQAPWERHTTPVSDTRMLANQKPANPMPGYPITTTHSPESDLGNVSNASSTERLSGRRHEGVAETELHARGTNAYAAWRKADFAQSDPEMESSSSESETVPMEDKIAQSVESGYDP